MTNFAALQQQIQDSPTLDQCRATGRTHRAYGWSKRPYGNWTEEQVEAYNRGYEDNRS